MTLNATLPVSAEPSKGSAAPTFGSLKISSTERNLGSRRVACAKAWIRRNRTAWAVLLMGIIMSHHIFCTSHSGGKKQLTQVGLFEKGSVKGLFTEMQVGSVKATQGPSLSK